MITFEMHGVTITMENKEFCDMMVELCKAVTNNGDDWNEYLNNNFKLVENKEA